MLTNIKDVLTALELEDSGKYDNHFYIIRLDNSDAYARMYTKLEKNAINRENPYFEYNTNNTATKLTTFFELPLGDTIYNLFLIADFENEEYKLKIGERIANAD